MKKLLFILSVICLIVGIQTSAIGATRTLGPDGWVVTPELSDLVQVAAVPAENLNYLVTTTTSGVELCSGPGTLLRVVTGEGQASSYVELYDQTGTGCTTGKIARLSTAGVNSIAYGATTANGLCLKTLGLTTGNSTVVYRCE